MDLRGLAGRGAAGTRSPQERRDHAVENRESPAEARHGARCGHSLRLHPRRRRRGCVAPAHREPRDRDGASRAVVRRPAPSALLPRTEERPRDRGRRRRARRNGDRRRAGRGEAHPGPVAERPPGGRERLLHVGHGAQGSAGRFVDRHHGCRSRAAERSASQRRVFHPGSDREDGRRPQRRHADVVLRARRRLHGLGPLRPQPDRPGPRTQVVQARRDGAHHDPVALGAGDRPGHDRTRGDPDLQAVRADVDSAVNLDSDHGERHPERLRLGAAHQGPLGERPGRGRRREYVRGRERSWQAVVPPGVCRTAGRGSIEAADRRAQRQQGGVPSRQYRHGLGRCSRPAGTRHGERSHAVGR